jgi:hypothetical protein
MCSFIDFLSLNTIVISSLIHHLIIFHCPLADLNTACFPSHDPLYCSPMVNFSRSVEKCWCHFYQGFCKFSQCSSCLTILFWNQLSYSKDHVYPKSSCWNEIREMSILKSIFGNQACLVKDPTHVIQCSHLIVLYFENRNDPLWD